MLASWTRKQIERHAPSIVAVGSFVACLCLRHDITHYIADNKLSVIQLYSGVFGWASVQTGALLSIYGMIFTKTDGFIGELRKLPLMEVFYGYIRRSLALGLVLTVITIPFLVFNRDIGDLSHPRYFAVDAWFSMFILAFASFVRVVLIFSSLVKIEDRKEVLG